ncbi:MAG: hypothetical protein GOMPHAMPRED_005284 [Gomphillus americanus]|uniref:Uncharacterized protein n=1 Tax=Gomphillus americanus TaxID=1940652 RepID=A0A8H3IPW6_9LECA|nr:MAG: hypothetical protein GOMPHAMPRED_005284 [Gomphillus americanus]
MKPLSILLLLSATLTAADPTLSNHDNTRLHLLQRRQHKPAHQQQQQPILIRRTAKSNKKPKPDPKAPSEKRSDSGGGSSSGGGGSGNSAQSKIQQPFRALTRLNQFDKSKYTIPGASRQAMLMGAHAAGGALMDAASMGGGSASALLAAGTGIQTAGFVGMAANHAFEHAREAVRSAKKQKTV